MKTLILSRLDTMELPRGWSMYLLDLSKDYVRENIIKVSTVKTVEEMWSAIQTVALPWSFHSSDKSAKRIGVMFIFCLDDEVEYVSPIMEDNVYWAKTGQRHVHVCGHDVGFSYFENMVLDVMGGEKGEGVKAFAYSCVGNCRKIQIWTEKPTEVKFVTGGKLVTFPTLKQIQDWDEETVRKKYSNFGLADQEAQPVEELKRTLWKYSSTNVPTVELKVPDVARAPINVSIDRSQYSQQRSRRR